VTVWGLLLNDRLAFHPAMAESATVAAVKRTRSWCMRKKFHNRRSRRLERASYRGEL
jgi:hypothetical protein